MNKFVSFVTKASLLVVAMLFVVFISQTQAQTSPSNGGGGGSSNPTPVPCYTFTTNLTIGSRGDDVTALQKLLISKGFSLPSLQVGFYPYGYYGVETSQALKKYQTSVGIEATGYFGPVTRASLNACVLTTPVPGVMYFKVREDSGSIKDQGTLTLRNEFGSIVPIDTFNFPNIPTGNYYADVKWGTESITARVYASSTRYVIDHVIENGLAKPDKYTLSAENGRIKAVVEEGDGYIGTFFADIVTEKGDLNIPPLPSNGIGLYLNTNPGDYLMNMFELRGGVFGNEGILGISVNDDHRSVTLSEVTRPTSEMAVALVSKTSEVYSYENPRSSQLSSVFTIKITASGSDITIPANAFSVGLYRSGTRIYPQKSDAVEFVTSYSSISNASWNVDGSYTIEEGDTSTFQVWNLFAASSSQHVAGNYAVKLESFNWSGSSGDKNTYMGEFDWMTNYVFMNGTGSVPTSTPASVNLTINGSSGPLNVNTLSPLNLSWTSSNADTCYTSNQVPNWNMYTSRTTSGLLSIVAPASAGTFRYSLTCYRSSVGSASAATSTVIVNVVATTTTPAITVTNPKIGEVLQTNFQYKIIWTDTREKGLTPLYAINLGGTFGYENIATVSATTACSGGTCIYGWIPRVASLNNQIDIHDVANDPDGRIYGRSSTFSIASSTVSQPSITVLSPNGGEVFTVGKSYTIRWNSVNVPSTELMQIYFDGDDGIARNIVRTANDGAESVYIPDMPLGRYRAEITSVSGIPGAGDFSDGYITIIAPPTTNLPPVINGVTAPTVLKTKEVGTWKIMASDPENGSLSYSIDWGDTATKPGMITAASIPFVQTSTFTHSYLNPGTYTVKVTVTDAAGQKAQTSSTVRVDAVTYPSATIDSASLVSTSISPTISGYAYNTVAPFGINIASASGDKVWGSGDIAVVNNRWSTKVTQALTPGTYTVMAYSNSVAVAKGVLTIKPQTPTPVVCPAGYMCVPPGNNPSCSAGYVCTPVAVTSCPSDYTCYTVTPVTPTTPTTASLSATLVDASSDKVGTGFAPGAGMVNRNANDWHWVAKLTLPTGRTIKGIQLQHRNEMWSSTSNSYYPVAVFLNGVSMNSSYNASIAVNAGATSLDLYGQAESTTFSGGTLTVTFDDGSTLTATVPASTVKQSTSATPTPTPSPTSQANTRASIWEAVRGYFMGQ
ncbi:MAG: PKD domain-containing protein [Patescibacteria group bacterium]